MSSLIRAPPVRNLACPTVTAIASAGVRCMRKIHTLPGKLPYRATSPPARVLPLSRVPSSDMKPVPIRAPVASLIPARGFWFFRPRSSSSEPTADADAAASAEAEESGAAPSAEERPMTPAEEADVHFARYLDALYRSRQASTHSGVPGGVGTGDYVHGTGIEMGHAYRFQAAAAAAAAADAAAANNSQEQREMPGGGGQGMGHDPHYRPQPGSLLGGLKHWLFSFRFITLVLTGVAVVATIGGTGYWIYGRNINTRLSNMAAEVTATTLSNDATKEGAVELSNKILGEPIVLQAAIAFVHKLSQDKETKAALVSLLGSVVSDPESVAYLKELVIALARDPATAAALGDLVSGTLQQPGVKEAAYEVFKQLLDDPQTRDMVHTVLVQITRRYLASPEVHESTKRYLVDMLADKQLHVSSGHALWESVKSAVYPRS